MTIQPSPRRRNDPEATWLHAGARDLSATHLLSCLHTIDDELAQVRTALRSRTLEMQIRAEQPRIGEPQLQPGSAPLPRTSRP